MRNLVLIIAALISLSALGQTAQFVGDVSRVLGDRSFQQDNEKVLIDFESGDMYVEEDGDIYRFDIVNLTRDDGEDFFRFIVELGSGANVIFTISKESTFATMETMSTIHYGTFKPLQ